MTLSLRLDLRQAQGLVMTPQLQQAIKLLQLSNLELAAYVAEEIEQNPFLDSRDGGEAAAKPEAGAVALSGTLALAPAPGASEAEDGWSAPPEPAPAAGLGIDSLGALGRGGRTDFDGSSPDMEARLTRPKSFRDRLIEQLHADVPPGPDRLIGLHLIDELDDAGYLTASLEVAARTLGVPPERVERVLLRLQGFEPTGVFARSLSECLALQLAEKNRLDPAMRALLGRLDLLARADFAALIRICGVGQEDLLDMIGEIRALNPKPGFEGDAGEAPPVLPDIFITPARDGWRVELNTATLPRVLVNAAYHAEVSRTPHDRRAKEYFGERFQSANWLVKALDQRARTVLRVAEAVTLRQMEFLHHGVRHLKPLVLRDIAEATGLHESTISRATADKYVATPRGTFPFKYFFSNALTGCDGASPHAAEAIRQRIRVMIERETPAYVLSDDQIVEELRAHGVTIARRTVAKYRESLHIPSSVRRRREKALRPA